MANRQVRYCDGCHVEWVNPTYDRYRQEQCFICGAVGRILGLDPLTAEEAQAARDERSGATT